MTHKTNRMLIVHPDELTRSFVDKVHTLGVEAIGIHPTGGDGAADSLGKLVTSLSENGELLSTIDYAKASGLQIEYELHAAAYLLPRSLFDKHPEYFRMNDEGERVADFNLCISCEEALGTVADRALQLAQKLYGSAPRFHFWMDDKKGAYCRCDRCRHLTPSDQQMIVMNRIADKLQEAIPDASVSYLAYFECVAPPENVKPNGNIFLEYAPFEKYTAKGDGAETLIEAERQMLDRLIEAFGNESMQVLEYWYDNSLLSEWKKPPLRFIPDNERIAQEIKEYEKITPYTISSFACFLGTDYEELWGDADLSAFAK